MGTAVTQNKIPFASPFPDELTFASLNLPWVQSASSVNAQSKAATKNTVETSSAMGYNGSTIDPIHLLAGGLPGLGAGNAYGDNPLFTGNYGVQPYQGQAFDNVQKLTSNAGNAVGDGFGNSVSFGAGTAGYGAAQTDSGHLGSGFGGGGYSGGGFGRQGRVRGQRSRRRGGFA